MPPAIECRYLLSPPAFSLALLLSPAPVGAPKVYALECRSLAHRNLLSPLWSMPPRALRRRCRVPWSAEIWCGLLRSPGPPGCAKPKNRLFFYRGTPEATPRFFFSDPGGASPAECRISVSDLLPSPAKIWGFSSWAIFHLTPELNLWGLAYYNNACGAEDTPHTPQAGSGGQESADQSARPGPSPL